MNQALSQSVHATSVAFEDIPPGIVTVTIDAEWQERIKDFELHKLSDSALGFYQHHVLPLLTNKGSRYFLSGQAHIALPDGREIVYVVLDAQLYQSLSERLEPIDGVRFLTIPQSAFFTDGYLDCVLLDAGLDPRLHKLSLGMYWSAVDLRSALSEPLFDVCIREGIFEQNRCIMNLESFDSLKGFKVVKRGIRDRVGWNPYGIKAFLSSVGIDTKSKSSLDDLKSVMLEAFLTRTKTAINYSIGDVKDLFMGELKFLEKLNEVRSLWGNPPLTMTQIKGTVGAIVADSFKQFLLGLHPTDSDKLDFALKKLGYLDLDKVANKNKGAIKANAQSVLKEVNSRHWKSKKGNSFIVGYRGPNQPIQGDKTPLERFIGNRFRYTAMNSCSVQYYADRLSGHTGGFNAIVQGGRCHSENPYAYVIDYIADIDLKSCYGTALRQFIYPLGLPTVIGYEQLEKSMTLGQFLAKYRTQLIPGLYQIVVNTIKPLSFRQDLIPSKTTTLTQIRKAYSESFSDTSDNGQFEELSIDQWRLKETASNIPGDFGITDYTILNGIITSDVLKVLDKVCSDREKSELMNNLQVVTAAFYRASDRVNDVDTWCNTVLDDRGSLRVKDGDTRTRKWLAVPIESFIGKAVEKRNEIKKLAKENPDLAATDSMLKLFVNTLYGVIASPYFEVGNTVVANNITAMARVGVWMINKSLHTVQSITDGGMYSPTRVPYLNSECPKLRLPSLGTLADNNNWSKGSEDRKYGRLFKSLGGLDWKVIYSEKASEIESSPDKTGKVLDSLGSMLDTLALEHIKEFWGNYGLSLGYAVEHKGANCGFRAAYWNKAHYAVRNLAGNKTFKIRGARRFADPNLKPHPMFELLSNILDGSNDFPRDLQYHVTMPIKISYYKRILESSENSYLECRGLKPGDFSEQLRTASFKDEHFGFDTVDDFMSAKRQREFNTVKGVKQKRKRFERFGEKGIATVHTEMIKARRSRARKALK